MIDSLKVELSSMKVKLSSTLAMHRRNNEINLQYHKHNENFFPEDYAHMVIL